MKIGVVKEIKVGENRVGMTPENVARLVKLGNELVVEENAGIGSGFSNEEYIEAGATMVTQAEAWNVDMVVKVKEPQASEYGFFKKDLIVWGFLHLAASEACVKAMVDAGTTAVAGETIVVDGVLKLLKPMSAIAGRRAVFMGAYYLEKQHGGEGILISGIDGIEAGTVVIFGGGNAAINSVDMALGIGANVVVLELNEVRCAELRATYAGKNVEIVASTEENLRKYIQVADIFISTILIPGAKPPKLVKEDMVKTMKKGSVLVDISIDQGGTVETIEHYTTHDNPVFEKHGVIHYAVPNMPGATPRTSTMALAKDNIEYLEVISQHGIAGAMDVLDTLASGVNIYKGFVTYKNLAETLGLEYTDLTTIK
ncbi:MAG: alanine dehydrogenase [Mycoplasmatales bacterium]